MIPSTNRMWKVGVTSVDVRARTKSVFHVSSTHNVTSVNVKPTSSHDSRQQKRTKHTKQTLRTPRLRSHIPPLPTTPRPLPRPLLPGLRFLLRIHRERRIAQVRVVQRRHSPRVEQSRLMSQLLHRALVAQRREQDAWYRDHLRRCRCRSAGRAFSGGAWEDDWVFLRTTACGSFGGSVEAMLERWLR